MAEIPLTPFPVVDEDWRYALSNVEIPWELTFESGAIKASPDSPLGIVRIALWAIAWNQCSDGAGTGGGGGGGSAIVIY